MAKFVKIEKAAIVAAKIVKFARSPQGKRDIALVVAAVSAAADFLKQAGVI